MFQLKPLNILTRSCMKMSQSCHLLPPIPSSAFTFICIDNMQTFQSLIAMNFSEFLICCYITLCFHDVCLFVKIWSSNCYQFNIPPKLLCYACPYTELSVFSCWEYILQNEKDAKSKIQKSVNKKIDHFYLKYKY